MTTRFLHCADLHLDTPFSARGRYPDHVASVLRDASLGAFERMIDAAIAHQVGFVVVAGDVYDGAERGVRAQLRFRDGLARLDEAGIRSFVAHGNHDPVDEGWSAIDRFPDLATIFPPDQVQSVPFDVAGEAVTVHGISYGVAQVTENLSRRYGRPTTPGLHVGVLHANVGSDPAHDPYSPCTVGDLCEVGLDYWALGHIHTRRVLHRDPWVVYPGNLQGRSIKPSEGGPKGALLVEAVNGRISEPRLLAFDLVRFARAEVDCSGLDLDGLVGALVAAGESAQAEADGRSVLLTARVVGRGGLHQQLRATDLASSLLAEVREAAGIGDPFLWWDELSVGTEAATGADLTTAEGSFGADLVDTARMLAGVEAEAPDPRVEWVSGLAPDLLRAAALHQPLPDVEDLWDEATAMALDLLGAESS